MRSDFFEDEGFVMQMFHSLEHRLFWDEKRFIFMSPANLLGQLSSAPKPTRIWAQRTLSGVYQCGCDTADGDDTDSCQKTQIIPLTSRCCLVVTYVMLQIL
ncbi:hypothetical protein NL108_017123 [Boleophthalmus pectinirostris]|nr:hypothetical protein NL108_017123 [Boleophthalmus pectinirostris]